MQHNIANQNEALEAHTPRHRDSKTIKPRNQVTEIIKLQHQGPETGFGRTQNHDINIPMLKNKTLRLEDQKVTTSSF